LHSFCSASFNSNNNREFDDSEEFSAPDDPKGTGESDRKDEDTKKQLPPLSTIPLHHHLFLKKQKTLKVLARKIMLTSGLVFLQEPLEENGSG
jgi:hypothetical protein